MRVGVDGRNFFFNNFRGFDMSLYIHQKSITLAKIKVDKEVIIIIKFNLINYTCSKIIISTGPLNCKGLHDKK